MASSLSFNALAVILALTLAAGVAGTLGGIVCENLDRDSCAFAVSSSGKRCVLEKQVKRSGEETYTCRRSGIEAGGLRDYIETDQCIKSCGVDRRTLGISSDALLEPRFAYQLCSSKCYGSCPNIVDLYFNLAAGEGVFLPQLCEAEREDTRRGMAEVRSSGMVAPGPIIYPVKFMAAPAMSPY
ncbi:uncharacterized protein LOC115742686 [Rhodamnia argentea]|uniref:Uncharacterized protein LOC115742686 n=1 Tax=Rhodamnia argentea TaxID=178133 RepID=A0A8B8PE85_9MYRT|nr:uncharacterized protein LOC115742686 [Rhodamnia argentea]